MNFSILYLVSATTGLILLIVFLMLARWRKRDRRATTSRNEQGWRYFEGAAFIKDAIFWNAFAFGFGLTGFTVSILALSSSPTSLFGAFTGGCAFAAISHFSFRQR